MNHRLILLLLALSPAFCTTQKNVKESNDQPTVELTKAIDSLPIVRADYERLSKSYDTLSWNYDSLLQQKEALATENQQLKEEMLSMEVRIKALKIKLDTLQAKSAVKGKVVTQLESVEGARIERLLFRGVQYDAFIVSDATKIQLFWKNKKQILGNMSNLKAMVESRQQELVFAVNAGMYTRDLAPQGLYVEGGATLIPIDTVKEGYGNFYMQPNGIFLIEKDGTSRVVVTDDYPLYQDSVWFATQSGPMLIIDNIMNTHFNEESTSKYVRNGVGIDDQGRTIFIISDIPVNLWTFASIFRDHYGCRNALYLDGAISKMYLPALGRVGLSGNFGPMLGVVR